MQKGGTGCGKLDVLRIHSTAYSSTIPSWIDDRQVCTGRQRLRELPHFPSAIEDEGMETKDGGNARNSTLGMAVRILGRHFRWRVRQVVPRENNMIMDWFADAFSEVEGRASEKRRERLKGRKISVPIALLSVSTSKMQEMGDVGRLVATG